MPIGDLAAGCEPEPGALRRRTSTPDPAHHRRRGAEGNARPGRLSCSTSACIISRSTASAPTLSGGEAQRIRLAGQIGCGLVGVLYILDEPSIGLHPRDNDRLLRSLERLRDMGNTVLVVEHDEDTMRAADYLVDFGPGPGVRGGEVVAAGSYADVVANPTASPASTSPGRSRLPSPSSAGRPASAS